MNNKSLELDQFFTKEEIAIKCLNKIKNIITNKFNLIIEPSVGSGNFYNHFDILNISNKIAFDIDKKSDYVIQKDYLTINENDIKYNKEEVLIIGNPPFGNRSKLALNFLLHSLKFANYICFILPISFKKYEIQNKIIKLYPNIKLILDDDLPYESFLLNNKSYGVRCTFQIWTLDTFNNNPDLKIINKPILKHKDFEMFLYNNTKETLKYFDKDKYKWNFAVPRQGFQNYNRRETNPSNLEKQKQWMFFKTDNDEVLNNLLNLDFDKLSKLNTSTPGFGKADVIHFYNNNYELF